MLIQLLKESWVQGNLQWIVALLVGIGQVWFVWLQLADVRRKNSFDIINAIADRFGSRFGKTTNGKDFYALRARFSGTPRDAGDAKFPTDGLLYRIRAIRDLPEEEWKKDFDLVRPLCNAFSDLGSLMERGVFPSRQVLSTYHLIILREGWLLEPYIYDYSLFRNPGRWGMRALQLIECARFYHEKNSLHSANPVYLTDLTTMLPTSTKTLPEVFVRREVGFFRNLYTSLLWALHLQPTVTQRRKNVQNRQLSVLRDRFLHLDRIGWP